MNPFSRLVPFVLIAGVTSGCAMSSGPRYATSSEVGGVPPNATSIYTGVLENGAISACQADGAFGYYSNRGLKTTWVNTAEAQTAYATEGDRRLAGVAVVVRGSRAFQFTANSITELHGQEAAQDVKAAHAVTFLCDTMALLVKDLKMTNGSRLTATVAPDLRKVHMEQMTVGPGRADFQAAPGLLEILSQQ